MSDIMTPIPFGKMMNMDPGGTQERRDLRHQKTFCCRSEQEI